jgi:radical SAM protein (TIGR01212 family)
VGGGGGLERQIDAAAAFLESRYGARRYFLYFQAYSSTNSDVDSLRAIYDEGLAYGAREMELRGLVVSTRPDCVDAANVDRGLEVWLELGLQSAHDRTLARLRRGHSVADFVKARGLFRGSGVRVAAHLILGLPGESREDMLVTARRAADQELDGLKLHDLHIPRGSALGEEYLAGELSLLHPSLYPALVADFLELTPPDCEILRLCSDSPPSSRLAPRLAVWPANRAGFDKSRLYGEVESLLESRGSRQGSLRGGN